MPTQPMTKFVVNDSKSTEPACLYLKDPTDDQLDAVLVWLNEKKLDMVTCLEGVAVFTKTGRGKPSPAIAIQFQSQIDHDAAAAKMAELYPAPKDLKGIKLTSHEVSEEQSEGMGGLADEEAALVLGVDDRVSSDELADHMDAVAADATAHAEAAIASAYTDIQPVLEPSPLGAGTAVSSDDVPF